MFQENRAMDQDAKHVKCAIYTRSATNSQASIDEQRRQCEEYALRNGWTVAAHYSDPARSASEITGRPALQALLTDAEKTPPAFGHVLVEDTSRLSRNLRDFLNIAKSLGRKKVVIHVGGVPLDPAHPHFRHFLLFRVLMDELYVTGLREAIQKGKRLAKTKIRCSSTAKVDRQHGEK
jgi:DNA invertase Pin-like site-specific DNA recombinase